MTAKTNAVVAALLAVALATGGLLWFYHPTIPRSVFGWALLFVIGIPTWFLLEWLGQRIVGARFFARLGSAARIALAIPILILFVVAAAWLIGLGQKAIGAS